MADLDRGRADIVIGILDGCGYSSPGRVYASREAYEAYNRLCDVWTYFRRRVEVTWSQKDGVTEADIRAAAALLKIELPGEIGAK